MAAYRKHFTLEDSGKLVLSGLPFSPGTRVEVTIEEELTPTTETGRRWAALFAESEKLPKSRTVTPAEISAEIAAYRAGK